MLARLGLLIAALVLAVGASPASSQTLFSGTVVGPDGLPVEGVTIFVTNVATRAQLEFATLPNGRFEFSGMPEGDYRITGGFSPGNFIVTLRSGEPVDRELTIPFGPFREEWLVMPRDVITFLTSSEQRPGFRCSDRLIINLNGIYQPFCNLSFLVDEFEAGEARRVEMLGLPRIIGGPRLARAPNQEYPLALAEGRVEGRVTLEARVGVDGTLSDVRVVSTDHPALAEPALASVASAAWEPARLRGRPVDVPMTIAVEFRLQRPGRPLPPVAQRVAMQVVRVTPTEETARRMVFFKPSGPYRITNYTVRELIRFAYTLEDERIVGLPAWANTERFDIEQRWETEPSAGEVQALVRDVLALQFNLTTHTEPHDFPGYALVRAGAALGPQLRSSSFDCSRQPPSGPAGVTPCQLRLGEQGIYGVGITMAQFASEMAGSGYIRVDRPVVDRTGLTGTFDVELTLLRMQRQPAEAGGGIRMAGVRSPDTLPVLLERELGLRLVEQPVPLDVLVVDRVSQPTAAR